LAAILAADADSAQPIFSEVSNRMLLPDQFYRDVALIRRMNIPAEQKFGS